MDAVFKILGEGGGEGGGGRVEKNYILMGG